MPNASRNAAIGMAAALGDAIRSLTESSPLRGVPSGELYARVMGRMDIRTYGALIGALKRAGLIEERSHLLTWVGPR